MIVERVKFKVIRLNEDVIVRQFSTVAAAPVIAVTTANTITTTTTTNNNNNNNNNNFLQLYLLVFSTLMFQPWMCPSTTHTFLPLPSALAILVKSFVKSAFSLFFSGGGTNFFNSNTYLSIMFFLWRCDPTRVMASSFLRFSRSHATTHHSR